MPFRFDFYRDRRNSCSDCDQGTDTIRIVAVVPNQFARLAASDELADGREWSRAENVIRF